MSRQVNHVEARLARPVHELATPSRRFRHLLREGVQVNAGIRNVEGLEDLWIERTVIV